MENESWRFIDFGFGKFSISSFGNIRNNFTGKLLSTQIQNSGYYIAHLNYRGKRKAFTIHRLVASAFIDKIEGKNLVDHIDGNKLNNHFSNLRWVNESENSRNAFDLGLMENSKRKAALRMKEIGTQHGFINSQKNLIMAKPVIIHLDGENHQFKSTRQAAKYLKIDHKTLSRRISLGLYK
jgi:hypothetical protein